MANLKRLAQENDKIARTICPVGDREKNSRTKDYLLLSPQQFSKKYRDILYKPVSFVIDDKTHEVQTNVCANPYCTSYGLSQQHFKGKSFRYRLSGSDKDVSIVCNPDPSEKHGTWRCSAKAISNWSVADEIVRLTKNNRVVDVQPEYRFHYPGCAATMVTPFADSKAFYRRGKSTSNSQKWQCKLCKKITNVMPNQKESHTYHQQRNEIVLRFAKQVLSHTPVRRICEVLEIGSSRYYAKLELLYKKCLEFLDRYEKQSFAYLEFNTMWVNTDYMQYNLNNIRKRGSGGSKYEYTEQQPLETYIVVSADTPSRYVLRSDIAYDWEVTLGDIEHHTKEFKDDHLASYVRRYARLRRMSTSPIHPTEMEASEDATWKYLYDLGEFETRSQYADGLHVNQTYTTIAQLWLIRDMIKADKWRFISDNDNAISTSILRVFREEVQSGRAHHFICRIDSEKAIRDAYMEYEQGRENLVRWGNFMKFPKDISLYKLALLKLEQDLGSHKFFREITLDGKTYRQKAKTFIEHPLPTRDKGWSYIDCTTDVSGLSAAQLSRLLIQVNTRATDGFMEQIRRRISTLERPLVTARNEGKSYIYSNFNPRYAQYLVTILRTYYNFCEIQRYGKKKMTPAQKLGLTDRQYTWKDIVYFR